MNRARTLLLRLHAMLRRQAPPGFAGPSLPDGHALVDYLLQVAEGLREYEDATHERGRELIAATDDLFRLALDLQAELDAAGEPRQTWKEWFLMQLKADPLRATP